MTNYIIYRTKLQHYKPVLWKGQALFTQYSKIKNYLKQVLGEDFLGLFAEPHISQEAIKGIEEAFWSSSVLSDRAKIFETLSSDKQEEVRRKWSIYHEKIVKHISSLSQSNFEEERTWADMLSKLLECLYEEQLIVEGEYFTFVLWGFQGKKLAKPISPIFTPIMPPAEVKPKTLDKNEENNKGEDKLYIEDTTPQEPTPPHINQEEPPTPQDQKEEPKQEEVSNDILKTETGQKPPDPPVPVDPPKKPWWRRYGWLGLILLVLLLLLLAHYCSKPRRILPIEQGKIIPIDTTKIVKDPDNVRKIVADRLNIALVSENKKENDLEKFAQRFKEEYPDEVYQIIYYDTLTLRLQIQIPDTQRETIKTELPQKLKEFKMLIWHEGLYQMNDLPRDPGFEQPDMYWYHAKVKALSAWDWTQGDTSMVVAIIDDGFDLSHPEFRAKIHNPRNIPDYSNRVNTGRKSFHGTHVAGIALGLANNGQGVAGIAPKVKFMPIQVGDQNGLMSTTAVIDGVLYAIHRGANVVNMSLGMSVLPEVERLTDAQQLELVKRTFKDEEIFWNQLFKLAYDRNIVFILAAGNQNVVIGLDPMQRSPYAIKVSATAPDDSKAKFSNYGQGSTISAPGVQIYSSMPKGRFDYLDGTSMAAPIVAGGVALIKSVNPALSFDQIVDLLQSTGIPIRSPSYIGNLIQLDRAIGVAERSRQRMPKVECPDVQQKIDSLLQEIAKLRRICPDSSTAGGETGDTLKIPSPTEGRDFNFATGRWKSTTYLYNTGGQQVTIYFDFYANGTGKITLVEEDNTQCTASVSLSLQPNQLNINQGTRAVCLPPPTEYNAYTFVCRPDEAGCAECTAQNKSKEANNFTFRLIKVR